MTDLLPSAWFAINSREGDGFVRREPARSTRFTPRAPLRRATSFSRAKNSQHRDEGRNRFDAVIYEMIPDDYEVMESEPILRKPMTPELQAILDDARQAGYFVQDDHANDGVILIRPYFEHELFLAEHPEEYLLQGLFP